MKSKPVNCSDQWCVCVKSHNMTELQKHCTVCIHVGVSGTKNSKPTFLFIGVIIWFMIVFCRSSCDIYSTANVRKYNLMNYRTELWCVQTVDHSQGCNQHCLSASHIYYCVTSLRWGSSIYKRNLHVRDEMVMLGRIHDCLTPLGNFCSTWGCLAWKHPCIIYCTVDQLIHLRPNTLSLLFSSLYFLFKVWWCFYRGVVLCGKCWKCHMITGCKILNEFGEWVSFLSPGTVLQIAHLAAIPLNRV